MLTDRAPFEYVYLSERLLTDLVRHEEAARSRWRGSFDINLRLLGLGLHLQRQAPDYTNLRDLAMRSLELVSDHCGGVGMSDIYVHDQMDLHHGVFSPHCGWPGGHIACYQGESITMDDQHVFVALFGSASNIMGRRRRDDDNLDYYPSDVAGLYALLDAARERYDPEIDLDYRWDDYALSNKARAEIAINFARDGAHGEHRRLEFLARVFLEVEDYDFSGDVYSKVVVGAPLWIATPPPKPFPQDTRSSPEQRSGSDH